MSKNNTTVSWTENKCGSWRAFYTRLFADCRARGVKPWVGNPMSWAAEMYQLTKQQAEDDELVAESCIDNIPFRDELPLEGRAGDLCYSLNPEEHLMVFEDVMPIAEEEVLEYAAFLQEQKRYRWILAKEAMRDRVKQFPPAVALGVGALGAAGYGTMRKMA